MLSLFRGAAVMSRYLDPKADVVFKKVFGEHPHLLISFLNAILPLPDDGQIIENEAELNAYERM